VFSATTFAPGTRGHRSRSASPCPREDPGQQHAGTRLHIAADLVLAPSAVNMARSGGTIYPVVKNFPPLWLTPTHNRRHQGVSCWTAFATTTVTGSIRDGDGTNLPAQSWRGRLRRNRLTSWLGRCRSGSCCSYSAAVTFIAYPPTITRGSEVTAWANAELHALDRFRAAKWRWPD
jgi:hypothetical protein